MRWVYIISEAECGPCKVGVSGFPPERLAQLQSGNGRGLKLWGVIRVPNRPAFDLEKEIHAHFSSRRMSGEWFNVPGFEMADFLCRKFKVKKLSADEYSDTALSGPHYWEDSCSRKTEISRVTLGRGVAASVPETARGRILKRDDEPVARQPEMANATAESSQPPHIFDRVAYQRDYMRDYRKAKPMGLSVIEYREKFKP